MLRNSFLSITIVLISFLQIQTVNASIISFSSEESSMGESDVVGSIVITNAFVDTNPNPSEGTYFALSPDASLQVLGQNIAIDDSPISITVKDDFGCDCFFIKIPIEQVLFGSYVEELFINIQSEFGIDWFTLLTSDAIPTETLIFPFGTSATLDFRTDSNLQQRFLLGELTIEDSIPVSVPNLAILVLFMTTFVLRSKQK